MKIGERIKRRRLSLGITADQLGEQIGKNRATVYRYESEEIEKLPIGILEPLAAALHTTPAYLMGWDEEEPQAPDQELAADEDRLLSLYRTLSPDGKTYIQNQMDIAATIYKKCPALPEQDVNAG